MFPASRRSGKTRVLMANEPRSYRQSIAAVFRSLRPDVEVSTVEPAELDGAVLHLSPDMVVCSEVTDAVRNEVPVWIELYPEHTSRAVVDIEGRRTEHSEIQLSDLLSILDRAEGLAQQD